MEQKKYDAIIIGAGLTGLTLAYYLNKYGKEVVVLEKQNRTGGVIRSIAENGFIYETGPSTGVVGTVEIAELFEDLQGKCEVEVAKKSAEKRFILKKGSWQSLPSGLVAAVKTPLFTRYDKFRILGEPFRKKGTNPNESIAQMVTRRLGKSYLDYAVDPFISGVYAGDPEKIITRFALPKLYALEQNYGSFIRGSIKKAKEPKISGNEKVTRKVFSIRGGLSKLTDALTAEIGEDRIMLNCKNVNVAIVDGIYTTQYNNLQGEKYILQSSNVICTIGGYDISSLFPFLAKNQLTAIMNTNYADVVQLAVGYKHWRAKSLEGFGGLVPYKEKRSILGILFPSAIFHNRTPEKGALLSVFIGGSRNPEMINKTDEELKTIVENEINSTFKQTLNPDFIRIFRHKYAIAQYDILSEERLQTIHNIESSYDGLYIAGSLRDGIGMADRVKQAKQLALLLSKK